MSGCIKGLQMHRVLHAPDRLKTTLIRTGPRGSGEFREASWSEALDLVAERLKEIKDKYGNESITHLGSSEACNGALHNTSLLTTRFLNMFGGQTRALRPEGVGIDPGTLQHTALVVLWGANISDTRLGVMWDARIREA